MEAWKVGKGPSLSCWTADSSTCLPAKDNIRCQDPAALVRCYRAKGNKPKEGEGSKHSPASSI